MKRLFLAQLMLLASGVAMAAPPDIQVDGTEPNYVILCTSSSEWYSPAILDKGNGAIYRLVGPTTGDIHFAKSAFVFSGSARNCKLDLDGAKVFYGCTDSLITTNISYGVFMDDYASLDKWFSRSDVDSYGGNASGSTITDGTIEQYSTASPDSSAAIMCWGQSEVTVSNVTLITKTKSSLPLWMCANDSSTVSGVTTVGPPAVENRHALMTAIKFDESHGANSVHDCVISAACAGGISISGPDHWCSWCGGATVPPCTESEYCPSYPTTSTIYNNSIKDMVSLSANAYGISILGPKINAYGNLIASADSSATRCRGIHIEGSSTSEVSIHDNYVNVYEYPMLYAGDDQAVYNGVHGLRVEYCGSDVEVYENTFKTEARRVDADSIGVARALAMDGCASTSVLIRNNVFQAQHVGGAAFEPDTLLNGQLATAFSFAQGDSGTFRVEDNTFRSNNVMMNWGPTPAVNIDNCDENHGTQDGTHYSDLRCYQFKGNTWEFFDNGVDIPKQTVSYWYSGHGDSLSFVDNVLGPGVDFTDVDGPNGEEDATHRITWRNGWSGTVTLSPPTSGVLVRAVCSGRGVASGFTDGSGQVDLDLWDWVFAVGGDPVTKVKSTQGWYTISASGFSADTLMVIDGWSKSLDVASGVGVPGADEPPAMARWGLSLAGGAVARGGTTRFLLSAPPEAVVTLVVFDVAGRRVRTLFTGYWTGGEREVAWDLRDEAGRLVPGALYFARLSGEDRMLSQRIMVLP